MGAALALTEAEEIEYLELLEKEEQHRKWELWRAGDLSWKLHDGQRVIYDGIKSSTEQEQLVFCARQFGKTFLNVIIALEFCLKNPRSTVRIAAETLDQVQNIISDTLEPICADAPFGLVRKMKSARRWKVGKSEIRLGALARAHVDTLRGGNAKLIITEEGGFVPSEDFAYAIRSVIGPQLLRSRGKLIHVTTPSEDAEHFIHAEILPKCALSGALYRFDVYSNPQLTPEHIQEAIKLSGGEHTDTWRREYLVQILRSTFMCVPEFDETLHVRDVTLPEHVRFATIVDFGGVRDKTVALLVYWDFLRAVAVVWDERHFEANTDTKIIVSGIREMERPYRTLSEAGKCDSELINQRYADAPGQALIDLRNLHEIDFQLPLKDDWMAGLNALRVALGAGKWEIHPRCRFLVQTLKSATFNRQRTDFNRTSVLGHMDALATLSYAHRMLDRETNPYPKSPTSPVTRYERTATPRGNAAIASANPMRARLAAS